VWLIRKGLETGLLTGVGLNNSEKSVACVVLYSEGVSIEVRSERFSGQRGIYGRR